MEILNGKWVDDNHNPIDNSNVKQLVRIGERVSSLYGKNITYDRINLISSITTLSEREENDLSLLLNSKGGISKLLGY